MLKNKYIGEVENVKWWRLIFFTNLKVLQEHFKRLLKRGPQSVIHWQCWWVVYQWMDGKQGPQRGGVSRLSSSAPSLPPAPMSHFCPVTGHTACLTADNTAASYSLYTSLSLTLTPPFLHLPFFFFSHTPPSLYHCYACRKTARFVGGFYLHRCRTAESQSGWPFLVLRRWVSILYQGHCIPTAR